MSSDPDVFRYSLRRVYRTRVRRMLLTVVPFAFLTALGVLGLILDHTPSQRHFYRVGLAFGVLCLVWTAITVGGLVLMYRASGVYLEGSQVGELFAGYRRPIRADVAHWLRKTMPDPAGLGRSRERAMLYAMTAEGERVLGVSTQYFEPHELDRLVVRSGIPVEGDWADRMTLAVFRRQFPLAPAARLSSRLKVLLAAAGIGQAVLIAAAGFVAFHLAQ
jgi:hypothetical protein